MAVDDDYVRRRPKSPVFKISEAQILIIESGIANNRGPGGIIRAGGRERAFFDRMFLSRLSLQENLKL